MTVYHPLAALEALCYVERYGRIDHRTYRALCPIWSDETIRLDLADLVNRGLLKKNGRKKGTFYTMNNETMSNEARGER